MTGRPRRPLTGVEIAILDALATEPTDIVGARYAMHAYQVGGLVRRAREGGHVVPRLARVRGARRPWTPADDARLVAMRNGGAADAEIMRALNRSLESIMTRMTRLRAHGVAIATRTDRWRPEQYERVVDMCATDRPVPEIAAAVGRSAAAVSRRIVWLVEDGTLRRRPAATALRSAA